MSAPTSPKGGAPRGPLFHSCLPPIGPTTAAPPPVQGGSTHPAAGRHCGACMDAEGMAHAWREQARFWQAIARDYWQRSLEAQP